MPSNPSKVKYGLNNVYYAVKQANTTQPYAAPVAIPGAVSISMEPQGELSKFYADNGVYWQASSNLGYEGDLEMAKFPSAFLQAIFGFTSGTNGVVGESDNVQPNEFALLFEFSGDADHTRYAFYNCIATRPNVSSSTTNESVEPTTETMTISAVAGSDHIVKGFVEQGATAYTNWFTQVTKPAST